MQFKDGAEVVTGDGEKVGTIDRVVLDPKAKEVTDIVVRRGRLLARDKLVPMSLVASATEERVTLSPDAGDLDALPNFVKEEYVRAGEGEAETALPGSFVPPFYVYPPAGVAWWNVQAYPVPPVPRYIVQREEQIPKGTVALKEGASVVSSDGKHVGDVEEVLIDPGEDCATHIVVAEGHLFKARKLVPTSWIGTASEYEVELVVTSSDLAELPDYELAT
jgi:uncharacterized protein YrrD